MPSMSIVLGSELSCSQVRLDRGALAGPCRTLPSRWNREPWHGQSKLLSVSFSAIEQPRCEQLIARTCILPCWSLTAKPPKARSPAALSPPPSAMMKAEFGVLGASNLTASPFASWSIDFVSWTLILPFFWPFGGAGQRYGTIGRPPATTVAVSKLAIHQPKKVRLVNLPVLVDSIAIRIEF